MIVRKEQFARTDCLFNVWVISDRAEIIDVDLQAVSGNLHYGFKTFLDTSVRDILFFNLVEQNFWPAIEKQIA